MQADAAYHDFENAWVQRVEVTRRACFDYYLAARDLELYAANVRIVQRFRAAALATYDVQQVTQRDDVPLEPAPGRVGAAPARHPV